MPTSSNPLLPNANREAITHESIDQAQSADDLKGDDTGNQNNHASHASPIATRKNSNNPLRHEPDIESEGGCLVVQQFGAFSQAGNVGRTGSSKIN